MSQTETGSHLPALAGHDDRLFSDDAVALVHQTSRGYPRAINNLALQALVGRVRRRQGHRRRIYNPHSHRRSHGRLNTTPTPEHHRPRRTSTGGVISCTHILTINAAIVLILSAGQHHRVNCLRQSRESRTPTVTNWPT